METLISPFTEEVLLRIKAVQNYTGIPRSSIYSKISKGEFTRPVSLGARSVAWPKSEVLAINQAHISGMSCDGIRLLVSNLMAKRASKVGE